MQLNIHNVCEYLLDKNYLKPEGVFASGFYYIEESRRNKNFLIRTPNNSGILLKQVRAFELAKTYSIENEARIYWLVKNENSFADLKIYLPHFIGFDSSSYILAIELLVGYYDLLNYYESNYNFIDAIPIKQAQILNSFHNTLDFYSESNIANLFKGGIPWIFNLPDASPQEVNLISKADYEIFYYIRNNEEFCQQIRLLKQNWDSNSVIHGDIKMPNFLINHNLDVKLIDWEMVQIGDYLWDVAGVFNDYFLFWTNLKHTNNGNIPKNTEANLFKSLNVFWSAYERNSIKKTDQSTIDKIGKYTAMRIIQTCIEHSHFKDKMSVKSKSLIDLSIRLMFNPSQVLRTILETHKNN